MFSEEFMAFITAGDIQLHVQPELTFQFSILLMTNALNLINQAPQENVFLYLQTNNIPIYLRSFPINQLEGLGRAYLNLQHQECKYRDLIGDADLNNLDKKNILIHENDNLEIVQANLHDIQNINYLDQNHWNAFRQNLYNSLSQIINNHPQQGEIAALQALQQNHAYHPVLDTVQDENYRRQLEEWQNSLRNRMRELGLEPVQN